jgi:hypothetical protein
LLLWTGAREIRVVVDLASRPSANQAFGFCGYVLVKPMSAHAALSFDHLETGFC